jgi:predicted DNA-binding protein
MAKKALRSVYLDLEQVERLKRLSDKTRVPQAVYIREGLDLVMSKHEKKLKKSRTTGKVKRTESRSLKLLKR